MPTSVALESGSKRVFACALDWPGWCRSGKDEESALDALAGYAPRYAAAAKAAGIHFPARHDLSVVEKLRGNATTDFGAPAIAAAADARKLTAKQAERQAALVAAAWTVFDEVVAGAPAALRKGPRGGGRDRDKMVAHVNDAEVAYARKIGIRGPQDDLRKAILDVLGTVSDGTPLTDNGWLSRYAARRIAWHALDHAWEIEDRSES